MRQATEDSELLAFYRRTRLQNFHGNMPLEPWLSFSLRSSEVFKSIGLLLHIKGHPNCGKLAKTQLCNDSISGVEGVI